MNLQLWMNFYLALATAAATLTGLMFIAVTFGSKLITENSIDAAQAFLGPIINHFALTFFISCVALIPGAGSKFLGITMIIFPLIRIWSARKTYYYLKKPILAEDIDLSDWVISLIVPVIIYFLLVVSGIGLLDSNDWSFYLSGLSMLSLISIGIINAWQMLMWMAYKLEK
jgi:hypothetical protein